MFQTMQLKDVYWIQRDSSRVDTEGVKWGQVGSSCSTVYCHHFMLDRLPFLSGEDSRQGVYSPIHHNVFFFERLSNFINAGFTKSNNFTWKTHFSILNSKSLLKVAMKFAQLAIQSLLQPGKYFCRKYEIKFLMLAHWTKTVYTTMSVMRRIRVRRWLQSLVFPFFLHQVIVDHVFMQSVQSMYI